MNRIPELKRQAIRNDKIRGLSIKSISVKHRVAKSTASLICRDLFEANGRKYTTELEARKAISHKHMLYPCQNNCGKMIRRKGGICVNCYKKDRAEKATENHRINENHHKTYPCRNNCGNMAKRNGGLCTNCYDIAMHKQAEIKQGEINKRKQAKINHLYKKFKPVLIDICPNSTLDKQAHYWILNKENVGECKFCHRTKDYKPLLTKYTQVIPLGS